MTKKVFYTKRKFYFFFQSTKKKLGTVALFTERNPRTCQTLKMNVYFTDYSEGKYFFPANGLDFFPFNSEWNMITNIEKKSIFNFIDFTNLVYFLSLCLHLQLSENNGSIWFRHFSHDDLVSKERRSLNQFLFSHLLIGTSVSCHFSIWCYAFVFTGERLLWGLKFWFDKIAVCISAFWCWTHKCLLYACMV